MRDFLKNILRDKTGEFSMREVVVLLFVLATITSWVSEQFFNLKCPEFMFYSFVSLIAAGCFGYTLEKKTIDKPISSNSNDTIQN